MKKKGKIHHWNTSRGMGLIRSPRTGYDILFHIRDYRGSASPREGETVWFDEITTHRTRPRAIEVSTASGNADVHLNRPRRYIGQKSHGRTLFLLLILWGISGAWGVWDLRLPLWVLAAALGVNLLTVLAYVIDTQAAPARRSHIPEAVMHLLSLLGGWPAAGLTQAIVRYRARNPFFKTLYWSTVTLHIALLMGWLFWLEPMVATQQWLRSN